jgi:hypothetical protein
MVRPDLGAETDQWDPNHVLDEFETEAIRLVPLLSLCTQVRLAKLQSLICPERNLHDKKSSSLSLPLHSFLEVKNTFHSKC